MFSVLARRSAVYRCYSKIVFNVRNIHTTSFRARFSPIVRRGLLFGSLSLLAMTANRRYHLLQPKQVECRKNSNRPSFRENTPLEIEFMTAIRRNDVKKIESMLETNKADVNMRHSLGWTPLHLAAILGHCDIMERLLNGGADVDAIDEFSNAAQIAYEHRLNFHQVYRVREEEFSDILSANVSFLGTTALHYACLGGHTHAIQLLMKHRANPNLENEFGHKAIDYLDREDPQISKIYDKFNDYCKEYEEFIKQTQLEERRKFPLEQRLREVIVGQEGAIATVAATIRRKENGWVDYEHPLVFLFLGSSGIGKTELAKQVAQYIHGGKKTRTSNQRSLPTPNAFKGFIRMDMSEYQEKHEVSKFIGSPPGYVGHEEGGQLTKALTDCPNAVVLFDEVEKAHPDVLTIMLQLFDEGRLTDGKGRTIECKDAIFIMTSNLASEEIANYGLKLRREGEEMAKAHYSGKISVEPESSDGKVIVSRYFKDNVIRPILKRHFKRDEFLGRINEIVYFLPFSRSELHKLVTRELDLWSRRALERHAIRLTWDRNVIGVLANGYDVHYGARSIKYEVERCVVNRLANAHENQFIQPGAKVHVVLSDDDQDFQFIKLEEFYKHREAGKQHKEGEEHEMENKDKDFRVLETRLKLLIENPRNDENKTTFFKKGK